MVLLLLQGMFWFSTPVAHMSSHHKDSYGGSHNRIKKSVLSDVHLSKKVDQSQVNEEKEYQKQYRKRNKVQGVDYLYHPQLNLPNVSSHAEGHTLSQYTPPVPLKNLVIRGLVINI